MGFIYHLDFLDQIHKITVIANAVDSNCLIMRIVSNSILAAKVTAKLEKRVIRSCLVNEIIAIIIAAILIFFAIRIIVELDFFP